MADTADDVGAIGFDLHAPAAPEALLATPQLPVKRRHGNRNARGQTGERSDEALPVRFSCGFKAKHGISYGSNNRPKRQQIAA
jgi:hypothetical protein